jgi:hypothetical protein
MPAFQKPGAAGIIAVLIGMAAPPETGQEFGQALKAFNSNPEAPPLGPQLSELLPAVQLTGIAQLDDSGHGFG